MRVRAVITDVELRVRAVITDVELRVRAVDYQTSSLRREDIFAVGYKVLKRGTKKRRWFYVQADDELGAFIKGQEWLRQKKYKV